jgi:hypothetical protein
MFIKHLFGTARSLIRGVEVENKRPTNELRQLHIATILILQNEWRQFVALRQLQYTSTQQRSQKQPQLRKSSTDPSSIANIALRSSAQIKILTRNISQCT